ncbi:MAG TPA: protein kinase, partial [Kofleriaceae bacterium]|nr:protein kinase [Kofleriaceae bacterium]
AKIVHDSDIDSSELTYAGQMIGTLDYMSPEQMVGGMCDATSDIYTLGVVMYEMIAGRKPFDDANSAAAALAAVLTTTPTRLAVQAMVPSEVDRVVMKCLERQHTDRYASATELAAALDEILASTEEAVTTVDLTQPVGGMTTIKGMRLPARLPSLTPPPPVADPTTRPTAPAAAAAAPAAPPGPGPSPTPIPELIHDSPSLADGRPAGTVPPAAPRATPTGRDGRGPPASQPPSSPPRLTPSVPRPAPIASEHTLVGPLPAPRPPARRARRSRQRPHGTPGTGSLPVATTNLREAYPTIHRAPPSPLRPQPSAFDDRPPSSVGVGPVFDMTRTVRRDTFVRWLTLGVAIAFMIFAAILLATW